MKNILLTKYCDDWIKNKNKVVNGKTQEGYHYRYKLIREYFGDKRKNLKDVTREDIKDFYNYLLFDAPNKRSKTGIGYTRRYVKDIRALFSQMLIDAVLDKYIIANPCDYVDIPNKEE